MSKEPITKENLLSALENGRLHKRQRKHSSWWVGQITEYHVDFQLTPEVEDKIRQHGTYLGKQGLDNLVAAIRTNYSFNTKSSGSQPNLEEPTFSEDVNTIKITIGGTNDILYSTTNLEKAPVDLRADLARISRLFLALPPMKVYVENKKPYFDVTIYGGLGHQSLEIRHNRLLAMPPGWDHNSNAAALEIVDTDRRPMFQLVYNRPNHILIYGTFPSSRGVLIATEKGININPIPLPQLTPIFKYPSWKYPGEYASAGFVPLGDDPLIAIKMAEVQSEWDKLTGNQKRLLTRILILDGLSWNDIDEDQQKGLVFGRITRAGSDLFADYLLDRSSLLERTGPVPYESKKSAFAENPRWTIKSDLKDAVKYVIHRETSGM